MKTEQKKKMLEELCNNLVHTSEQGIQIPYRWDRHAVIFAWNNLNTEPKKFDEYLIQVVRDFLQEYSISDELNLKDNFGEREIAVRNDEGKIGFIMYPLDFGHELFGTFYIEAREIAKNFPDYFLSLIQEKYNTVEIE